MKVKIQIDDALHWKLNKRQSLHTALINYACSEAGVSTHGQSDSAVYVKDSEFVVEIDESYDANQLALLD